MTKTVLLASLVAGALTVPVLVSPATASELAIREIIVRPGAPVVGAAGSVHLVIDVVARGAEGKSGVRIEVEPGSPPRPAPGAAPIEGGKTFGPVPVTPEVSPGAPPGAPPEVSPGASPSPSLAVPDPSPTAPPSGTAEQPGDWSAIEPEGAPMRRGDGWETWRFLPARGLTRRYPSGIWTITATATGPGGVKVTEYGSFTLRRETRLKSVRAERVRASKAVRLRGTLTRVDPQGYTDYSPFARQRVEVFFRRKDAGSWRKVATATTAATGTFARTVKGRAKGFWRVRHPATGHYAADLSSIKKIGH